MIIFGILVISALILFVSVLIRAIMDNKTWDRDPKDKKGALKKRKFTIYYLDTDKKRRIYKYSTYNDEFDEDNVKDRLPQRSKIDKIYEED
jgi:hypothetical protein